MSTNGTAYAAVYCRVSSDEQLKGYSIDTQKEACLELAEQEGYTVRPEHIFCEDFTGTALHRPKLYTLRDLVQNGLIKAVIVHYLDRLARNLVYKLLLQDEIKKQEYVCMS